MQTIKFWGASDDLIEVDGRGGDEFGAEGEKYAGIFNVGGMIRVFAMYVRNGVWTFAVAQVDDGVPLPDWPIRIVQCPDCEYSIQLEIDAPDHVVVFRERNEAS